MTNEDMERGIEFLLKHQADFEARQSAVESQLATMVKTHTEFTQFVQSNLKAQSELNESLRETVRALTINQARTDERVSELERQ